jgi:acetylornithine deacetylase
MQCFKLTHVAEQSPVNAADAMTSRFKPVLDAIDPGRLAADVARLVRAASPTGQERPALDALCAIAAEHGLEARRHEHDLAAVRADPGYPGEEAARDELHGVSVTLPGAGGPGGARRLALNGHVDVVPPSGADPWRHPPFAGVVADGSVHGCGALDMKGSVVAALHAMSAVRAVVGAPAAEVVLHGVSSEEDGGLGTFAALREDARFDACLIPEPTAFDVVVAHGGALTFSGTVHGVSAHAAVRLEGVSAIDRYVRLHAALADHERALNTGVAHPLMAQLPLPYPLLVGRVQGGQWSSQVPDRLEFEARLGVAVGTDPADARAALEAAVAAADDGLAPPTEIRWHGGQFAPAQTPLDDPFVALVHEVARAECDPGSALAGAPYGADMRHYCAHGIPCVVLGPPGLERAHATDEHVVIDDLVRVARAIALTILRF